MNYLCENAECGCHLIASRLATLPAARGRVVILAHKARAGELVRLIGHGILPEADLVVVLALPLTAQDALKSARTKMLGKLTVIAGQNDEGSVRGSVESLIVGDDGSFATEHAIERVIEHVKFRLGNPR